MIVVSHHYFFFHTDETARSGLETREFLDSEPDPRPPIPRTTSTIDV